MGVVDDHGAINQGWSGQHPGGGAQNFRVSIKCAPVIAIVDQSCFGEEAAHRWARAVLGETARLDYLRTFEQVRFRRDGPDGMPAAFALLWPAGCLELITPIEHSLDDQQRPTIAVAEIASEVVRFATTIRERDTRPSTENPTKTSNLSIGGLE